MLKNNLKKVVAVALLVGVVFSFSACGKKEQNVSQNSSKITSEKIDKIKKAGKIVVGTSADYPPYEFHKSINGKDEIVGFDIEIGKEIAKDLGVKLEIKDMKFDGLLAALDAGNIDFVVAGMTPTEERAKNVDFSKIYYTAVQTIVVRTTDKDKIKSADDLKGKKIGVQKGSVQEEIAKKQVPGAEAVALGKISDLALSLKNNKIDAAIIEGPVAKSYVASNSDLVISEIKVQVEDAGSAVAVKKGNVDLVEAVNKTLDKLINDKAIDKFVTDATNSVE